VEGRRAAPGGGGDVSLKGMLSGGRGSAGLVCSFAAGHDQRGARLEARCGDGGGVNDILTQRHESVAVTWRGRVSRVDCGYRA